MSGKYFIYPIRRPAASSTSSLCAAFLLVTVGFLVSPSIGIPVAVPDEPSSSVSTTTVVPSTTVKILLPPSSTSDGVDPSDDDDDDAIIIDAGNSTNRPPSKTFQPSDCFLEKLKGPCRAIIDMWYFNVNTKQCEQFQYSGCGGNGNRFGEKSECESRCGKEGVKGEGRGTSDNESGTCPNFDGCGPLKCAVIKDEKTGCEKCACTVPEEDDSKLPVGSVSGNPTEDDEARKESDKPEDICGLPEVRGDCRAMVTRYRYDANSKKCVMFHFGGCNSNGNNFVSEEKCNAFCQGQ